MSALRFTAFALAALLAFPASAPLAAQTVVLDHATTPDGATAALELAALEDPAALDATVERLVGRAPSATPAEVDARALKTGGQRRINLIWESTQALVAIAVTVCTLGVCAYLVTHERGAEGAFLLLSNVFFLVVGTYFQRTNHTRSSGDPGGVR